MLLKKLFSKAGEKEIRRSLRKNNIQVPDNYEFAKMNLVIGPNGSGKTRFLNAVKGLYGLCGVNVLYGYFPALSDRKISGKERGGELPEWTLYESLYDENVSFSDFFREIEWQNETFIPSLLVYHSKRQKVFGEKALRIVFDSFRILTGKEVVSQEERLFIRRPDGSQEALSEALTIMSPGELMLFYMSIFLAIQQNGKKNKVIILDEPESHLHPKALLSFLKMLRQTDDFQEIWIATHSLFVVPEFAFEEITYLYDSAVRKRTSKLYQDIMAEVLGDEEGKTRNFFASLSQWQYCEFLAECFTDPTVIDTVNARDEQVQLFKKCLKENKPYRILDCGGGSGRLGLSLKAAQDGDMQNICYEIYDRDPSYTGKEFRVYKEWKEVKGSYDCIVMMNFLHEVEPPKWVKLFQDVHRVLKEKGHLVFVEVAALSQGEMPNRSGYFVLGKGELEILFGCQEELEEIRHREAQKSCCILVPREKLAIVDDKRVNMAIAYLKRRMMNNIREIRQNENVGERNGRNGRYYAFLTQQYINVELFLEKETGDAAVGEEALPPQNRSVKNAEKINRLLKALDVLDAMRWNPSSEISTDTWIYFSQAVRMYQKYGKISKTKMAGCWEYIRELENKQADKKGIALLLMMIGDMGDPDGYNKILGNYNEYMPECYRVLNSDEFVGRVKEQK